MSSRRTRRSISSRIGRTAIRGLDDLESLTLVDQRLGIQSGSVVQWWLIASIVTATKPRVASTGRIVYQDDHGCIPIETVTWRGRMVTQIMDHAREISTSAGGDRIFACSTGGIHGMTADLHGGRILDTAKGILIGLRRCPSETAFNELISAAQRHRMPVFAMAGALVHLANGGERSAQMSIDAESAARNEWGQLFADAALTV